MSEVNINYKGSKIAGMDASGTKMLLTEGKYCEDDITVEYTRPSGGGGSSMNVQFAQSTERVQSTGYTSLISLTCSTAGKYDIYWDCFRSTIGGTSGSQLYINGNAQGTANTTFTNSIQINHLMNVTLAKNDVVEVYARSRSTTYFTYVGTLIIKQTS